MTIENIICFNTINMKKSNYQKLKEQLKSISETEDLYADGLSKGENPIIDGMDYKDAMLEQAGVLVVLLEDVLEDEQEHTE